MKTFERWKLYFLFFFLTLVLNVLTGFRALTSVFREDHGPSTLPGEPPNL
jgi:hypothetical protein